MTARSKAEDLLAVALAEKLKGCQLRFNPTIPLTVTCPDVEISKPTWIKPLLIYLDGEQVHRGAIQGGKDAALEETLDKKDIPYMRFRYKAPISKRRLKQIVDAIVEAAEGAY